MRRKEGARRLPLMASVAVVCRSRPQIDALEEVKQAIEAFADVSPLWTMPKACTHNIPGLLRLLRRIKAQQDPDMDPLCKHLLFESTFISGIRLNNTPVIRWAVKKLSQGCKIQIRTAVEVAILAGRLDVLEWLRANCRSRVVWEARDLVDAVTAGRSEAVQWLHTNAIQATFEDEKKILKAAVLKGDVATAEWVCQLHLSDPEPEDVVRLTSERARVLAPAARAPDWDDDQEMSLMEEAIAGGHFEMAKWLFAQGVDDSARSSVLEEASDYGYFEMVKWAARTLSMDAKSAITRAVDRAVTLGCVDEAQDLIQEYGGACTTNAMDQAAARGHLDMVKWLHEHRSEGCSVAAMDGAARNGHAAVVQWLHENRSEGCTVCAMDDAAGKGHLNVVQWLDEHRTEGCTPRAIRSAAAAGHLSVVQWFHKHRPEGFTTGVMDAAAVTGQLKVIQWLHEHRSEGCTTHAMDAAARSRQLYRFCYEASGLSSSELVDAAEESNCLAMVKYLHENRREGCTVAAMDNAARSGFLKVVQWLHTNRSEGCTTAAMDGAGQCGHVAVVKWLNENRSEGCSAEGLNEAAKAGWLEVVQYLHMVRGEAITKRAILLAATGNHAALLKWLLRHYTHERIESDVMQVAVKYSEFGVAMVLRDDGRCDVGLDAYKDAVSNKCYTLFLWLLNQNFLGADAVMKQLLEASREDTHLRECLDEFQRLCEPGFWPRVRVSTFNS